MQGTGKSVTLVKAVVKIPGQMLKTHQYQEQLREQAGTHIHISKISIIPKIADKCLANRTNDAIKKCAQVEV